MSTEKCTTGKTILAILLGIVLLTLTQQISSLVYNLPLPHGVNAMIYGVFFVIISYILIKLSCNKILYISLEECYIKKPEIQARWLICAILLPTMVSAVLLCSSGEFVKNDMGMGHSLDIVVSAIFSVGLGAGVVEEMVFRGLIMKAFEKRWGKIIAIIIPSVIFGLLHAIGRDMNMTDILFLFIAGTSVGIMFSLIVYESGSIWSSAIVHGIWNVIIIGKILNISIVHNDGAIFSYKLSSNSFILTGGAFGVEASLVAVLAYFTVIVYTLYLIKRKTKNTHERIIDIGK